MLAGVASLRADDISVTNVAVTEEAPRSEQANAEIVVNQVLKISDIKVQRSGGKTMLIFPEYVSRKGRVFPQVRLITAQANKAVRAAVEHGETSGAGAPTAKLSYRVSGCTVFKKKSRLKGIVVIRFNDAVEVECKLVAGKNGTWIVWPESRRRYGEKSRPQVTVLDKRMKESIEQDILGRLYSTAAGAELVGH